MVDLEKMRVRDLMVVLSEKRKERAHNPQRRNHRIYKKQPTRTRQKRIQNTIRTYFASKQTQKPEFSKER